VNRKTSSKTIISHAKGNSQSKMSIPHIYSLILVKLLLNQYLPIALILHNDTPIDATELFVPSVKGQRRLLLHIKIKFHYFTQGIPWIMLFTWILTISLNHSMFIVSCKVLSCTSMSMPRTIVVITHTKHNMKIPWMEHHIQTPKWSFTWMKIKI